MDDDIGVIDAEGRLGQIGDLVGIRDNESFDVFRGLDQIIWSGIQFELAISACRSSAGLAEQARRRWRPAGDGDDQARGDGDQQSRRWRRWRRRGRL